MYVIWFCIRVGFIVMNIAKLISTFCEDAKYEILLDIFIYFINSANPFLACKYI